MRRELGDGGSDRGLPLPVLGRARPQLQLFLPCELGHTNPKPGV